MLYLDTHTLGQLRLSLEHSQESHEFVYLAVGLDAAVGLVHTLVV